MKKLDKAGGLDSNILCLLENPPLRGAGGWQRNRKFPGKKSEIRHMASPQKLPIGIQAFETIRENNYLYVDKTQYVHRLVDEGMFYFFARPRRFGKSLLVSTLKCLFQGKKSLFEGLWIAKHTAWEWKKYPVLIIDFNELTHDTPEHLQLDLERHLLKTARMWKIHLEAPLLKGKLGELVFCLHQKTRMPVVILIDEYDKPIIDHLGKGEEALKIARKNRDILRSFLGTLKGTEISPLLRFVFITGVSRFSRVSIFSELNNLDDITMNETYAGMLGYVPQEIERHFQSHMAALAQKHGISPDEVCAILKKQYDGYRFSDDETRVYNPFSTLSALKHKNFKSYWFETGTPAFLVNLLREKQYDLPEIENMEADEQVFSTYDIDKLQAEALLFQTGYVTIKAVENGFYTFGYPNQEVRNAFLKHLLLSFMQEDGGTANSKFLRLSAYLRQENFDAFFETITAIFAAIPYTLNTQRDEAYFHTLFYLMVSASGADAENEVLTSRGRIDLVVEFSDKVFLMEFKCNQCAKAGIKQIQQKGYAEKFRQSGKKLILMGINFSSEKRNLAEWKIAAD